MAALAVDEFLLWVKNDAAFQDAPALIGAAKQAPGTLKAGGSQAKDVDQILVRQVENATEAKFIYVPFKSGSEAAVQLAGAHIELHTNNPAESVSQWRGGTQRPSCVFAPERMALTGKVTETMAWSDIPTCKEQGVPIERYQMPRTVFMPGGVDQAEVAFFVDLLQKVVATPEWQDYLARSAQTGTFLTGPDLATLITQESAAARELLTKEGWLVGN